MGRTEPRSTPGAPIASRETPVARSDPVLSSLPSTAGRLLLEKRAQRDGIVVIGVPGAIHERDPTSLDTIEELSDRIRLAPKLPGLTPLELLPAPGVVIEPLPELGRGSDVTLPFVDREFRLRDASRPDPIDEDAVSIVPRRRLVGPPHPDSGHRSGFHLTAI